MQLQDLRILTSPKNFSDVKDKVTRGVFAIILNMIQALYSHVCPSGRHIFVTKGEIWVEEGDFRGDLGGF